MFRSFRHSLEKETKHNGSTKSRSVAKDPGPSNTVLDAKNPDSMLPPVSDAGAVPTFKYPFSFAHKRLHTGGWSHEVVDHAHPATAELLDDAVMRDGLPDHALTC